MKSENIVSLRKNLREYKAVIFDVDGTLYYQPKLRLLMACSLLKFYLLHPMKINELFILKKYRSVREHWQKLLRQADSFSDMEEDQYAYTAEQLHVSPSTVKKVITYWIHEKPLSLLPKCKDAELASFIELLHENSIITAVYSDYPAEEKLNCLHICTNYIFCSSDKELNCMKPDPKGMSAVLKKLDVVPQDALMIGDRYSKDGLCAKNMDMDFIILNKSMSKRIKLYRYYSA